MIHLHLRFNLKLSCYFGFPSCYNVIVRPFYFSTMAVICFCSCAIINNMSCSTMNEHTRIFKSQVQSIIAATISAVAVAPVMYCSVRVCLWASVAALMHGSTPYSVYALLQNSKATSKIIDLRSTCLVTVSPCWTFTFTRKYTTWCQKSAKCTAEISQRIIDWMLEESVGISVIDDILIAASTMKEHDKILL